MVLFNIIPYKRMRLTSKVNLTKHFSENYKRMCLITRLYSMLETIDTRDPSIYGETDECGNHACFVGHVKM